MQTEQTEQTEQLVQTEQTEANERNKPTNILTRERESGRETLSLVFVHSRCCPVSSPVDLRSKRSKFNDKRSDVRRGGGERLRLLCPFTRVTVPL